MPPGNLVFPPLLTAVLLQYTVLSEEVCVPLLASAHDLGALRIASLTWGALRGAFLHTVACT